MWQILDFLRLTSKPRAQSVERRMDFVEISDKWEELVKILSERLENLQKQLQQCQENLKTCQEELKIAKEEIKKLKDVINSYGSLS